MNSEVLSSVIQGQISRVMILHPGILHPGLWTCSSFSLQVTRKGDQLMIRSELSTGRMDPRVGSRFCRILAGRVSISDFLVFNWLFLVTWIDMNLWKLRVGPRVGSGQTFCRQSQVWSGQRFAGSGRVQEKWLVDNSGSDRLMSEFIEFLLFQACGWCRFRPGAVKIDS